MDAVVFASRTGVRLELAPAAYPHGDVQRAVPTWRARLTGDGLDASLVCPEAGWEQHSLSDYLAALDRDWRGWEGDREWHSEEAELQLSALHDKPNTVLVRVELTHEERWRCAAGLELDPGVFRQLAADARRLGAA